MATSRYYTPGFVRYKSLILLFVVCTLLISLPAFGQETKTTTSTTFLTQKYLLGDWGGQRTKLEEEKGVTFDFHYIGDFLYAGNARIQDGGAGWNRVRGTMDIDFGKLAGWKGWSFHVTGLWQGGPNLGANYLGSISNPSTLVSARTEMLDSYWLAWTMPGDKATLRFGQFASMDYYGLAPWIWHFAMEPISYGFYNRWNDYASFDPASGPGVQLIVSPYKFMDFSVAYTSGNRDPYKQDPNGFHFVKHDSGVLSDSITIKLNQPTPGKAVAEKYYSGYYEVGSTYNGGKFTNPFFPVPLYQSTDTGNYVFYFQGQQAIFRPKAGSNTGLDLVGGMAFSPSAPYNFVDRNFTFGVLYNGPFPKRPNDTLNFGLSYTHVSDAYNASYLAANPGASKYIPETAFEFNYMFQATPYWYIQPVVQFYHNTGGFQNAGTGVVAGFRTKVTF